MMDGLAPVDGWTLLAIVVKAVGYGAALVAMGGPLFVATFRTAPDDVQALARKCAVIGALVGLAVLSLRFGIRAARLSGTGLAGAMDGMMLGIVWESPLGTAALWRGAGEALVLGLVSKQRAGLGTGLAGALLIATSYVFVGHSLGEPRIGLAALLIVHLLVAAFWIGALAPLHRAASGEGGATLLHRFGTIASGTVALLVLVGAIFAWLMIGSLAGLFGTAYGWTLIAKLALVTGLLGLAARNKLGLVPALAAGDAAAPIALRRSIRAEMVAVGVILLATATLTSVTTPPVNL